jgi:hypothetical protein
VVVSFALAGLGAASLFWPMGGTSMVMWGLLAIASIPLYTLELREARRGERHLCPQCQYDRTGLDESMVCPECGAGAKSICARCGADMTGRESRACLECGVMYGVRKVGED